jgi:long-chain acyl-CoA synthetase
MNTSHSSAARIDDPLLYRTVPSLLDRACHNYPNLKALNHWRRKTWQSWSTSDLRRAAEETALGLQRLGLTKGDPIALVMHNDVDFAIADLGTLLAGSVNVPIDLTQTIENILYILRQVEAPMLVVSNLELLYQLMPYFWEVPMLRTVVVADVPEEWDEARSGMLATEEATGTQGGGDAGREGLRPESVEHFDSVGESNSPFTAPPPLSLSASPSSPQSCLQFPHFLYKTHPYHPCPVLFPPFLQVFSLEELREWGRQAWSEERAQRLRHAIAPQDLATIIYIAGETKRPRGVMLTHENITVNVLATFSSYPHLQAGPDEVALLFLPLTHIFARVFLYGHLAWGHSIYFSDPNHLVKHLRRVKPTILITVPRLLEKIHERILERQHHHSRFDRRVLTWAIKLAAEFDLNHPPQGLYRLQWQLANRLVFGKWRDIFGGRLRACICGGAALSGELVTLFSAAGVPVYQGYGLTETSGVLCYNRDGQNRAGTVGIPIPGVEIALAADQEILVRSPVVMQGYFRDPTATQAALEDGWLHTGDFGTLSTDGFLTITGVKKPLFKLSTGKYASPLPLENELMQSPMVNHAVTIGANHKFCAMLVFANTVALSAQAQDWGIEFNQPGWLHHPRILSHYQNLIDAANCHLPYWSTVRKFILIDAELSQANGLLNPDGSVNRMAVWKQFAGEIRELYGEGQRGRQSDGETRGREDAGRGEGFACPVYARSLMGH